MNSGLFAVLTSSQAVVSPLFAQFGGGKNYWVDLILIAVMFGLVVFVVGRASRRY